MDEERSIINMATQETPFGRIEIDSIPLPDGLGSDLSGTYTWSGRVLVAARQPEKGKDWYRVFTQNEDGSQVCEVFSGEIPQKPRANGIRWMCFWDNRRVLLGDYVLEADPDLDHCASARIVDVIFPEEIEKIPGLFMRWSEPIVSPDGTHVVFSSLTGSGAFNFLARLNREEGAYRMTDACVISTPPGMQPDPDHPGSFLRGMQRGGEVKQFVRGGRGITLAGSGRRLAESNLQMLDSEEYLFLTDTLGYEETAILSPDEKMAVCMSPRFSPGTDAGVLGVIPMEGDLFTRGRYLNVLYQYAISGVRNFRRGNIGPALIDVERSLREGQAYTGVNLSDPENRWVYYSPMSWHPDSTRALWNERTRPAEGAIEARLRRVRLLDKAPAAPVPVGKTPDRGDIPYALDVQEALSQQLPPLPLRVHGVTGWVDSLAHADGWMETLYENYSTDGKTFYNGSLRCKAPANMFTPGVTQIVGDVTVSGSHQGRMDLRLTLRADERFQIHPDFSPAEDGQPQCAGYAEYDGIRRDVKDMSL